MQRKVEKTEKCRKRSKEDEMAGGCETRQGGGCEARQGGYMYRVPCGRRGMRRMHPMHHVFGAPNHFEAMIQGWMGGPGGASRAAGAALTIGAAGTATTADH